MASSSAWENCRFIPFCPFLRWLQSDLIVVEWFERRGHGLSWDSVALVHWDLLLAEPLEEVLPDLAFGQLYFSGLRTIDAALESAWVWTSRPPNRSSYLRFREQLAALGHRGAPLACIFMFSVLTRDFLLKYQRDSRLFSGLNEYKLPSLARHYGLPIMEKDLGVLWDPLEDRADAPMNAINRPISRQFVSTQLARKGGWRVFHPFIEPWEASDHPRRSDAP